MPWGKVTKEDLIEAGLNPDEFKTISEKLQKAASTDDVTELKNAVTNTQNTLKELQTTLQTLAASRSNEPNEPNKQNVERHEQNPQPGQVKIDPLEFMENPTDSVRKIMQESLAPITLHSLNVAADMAYNMAKQRLPYFEKFEPEIKELWNKYGPAQKGKPDELVENIYNLVKGRHMDDIITDTNKREGKYNLVSTGGTTAVGAGGGAASGRKPEDDLTPKELEVAARFGLTPKEWAEQKGGLKYV